MDSSHSAGYTPYVNLRQTLLERGGIEPHPSVIPPMLPVTTLSPSSFIRPAGTGLSKRTPVESSTAARVTLQPWRLPASCRSELLEDNSTSARLYLSILRRRTYELGLRYRSYSPDPSGGTVALGDSGPPSCARSLVVYIPLQREPKRGARTSVLFYGVSHQPFEQGPKDRPQYCSTSSYYLDAWWSRQEPARENQLFYFKSQLAL